MPGAPRARLAASSLLALACASAPPTTSPRSALGAAPVAAESSTQLPALAPVVNPKAAAPMAVPPAVTAAIAGPFTFETAAPDGRWILTCQIREDSDGDGQLGVSVGPQGELRGDVPSRYLSLPSGAEQPIDDLLASSADGRWLVISKDSKDELFDTISGARVDLTALRADTRREPQRRSGHRSLVFDGDSLFYLRGELKSLELVERRLSSGDERVLYRSSEAVLRVEPDSAGRQLVLTVAGADANGNGRFDWPFEPERGTRPCQGPISHYRAGRLNADPVGYVVVDRASAEARRVDDLAVVFGNELVRRGLDGALLAERGKQRRMLADNVCAGRVLWLDPGRDQLLVGCTMPKKTGRLAVELVVSGRHSPLEIDVAALAFDESARPSQRLVPLYPGAEAVLYDAEKRMLHRLKSGDAVLSTWSARALVRRGRSLLFFDAEIGSESPLSGKLDALADVLKNGALVFASPFVIDVAEGRVLGTISGRPLALSSSGAALVPALPATAESLAQGPLTWQTPG